MPAHITWCDGLSRPGDLPAATFIDLADPALLPLGNARATEDDLRDIGRRTGADAIRFLARRALLRCWIGRFLQVEPEGVAIRYGTLGAHPLTSQVTRCSAR